jgi:uncharacterized repeat protein (TIGR01451 family)
VDQGVEIGFALTEADFLVDIDGQLRPSGGAYDIGADEVLNPDLSVAFVPQRSVRVSRPGRTVTHTHWLVNTAPETASAQLYALTAESDRAWPVDVDPDSVSVGGQETATVRVYVTASSVVTTNGVTDRVLLTATGRTDPQQQASAQDFTTVISATSVDLGVVKRANVTQIDPGEAIHYTLTVTATGTLREQVSVTLTDRLMPADAVAAWSLPEPCVDHDRASGTITCTLTMPKGTSHLPYTLGFDVTTRGTYTGGTLFNRVVLQANVPESNPLNNASQATVIVAACTPVATLQLTGPDTGRIGDACDFEAEVGPGDTTLPVLYDWRASGQAVPRLHTQGLTDTAAFIWNETGTQRITLTVSNLCGGDVHRLHTVEIMAQLYLPLILRR